MKEGDVVLTPVPQANGMVKRRPAIILCEMPPFKDFLVCGVSTQLKHHVNGFDEIISSEDSDFDSSGLLADSLIRLGFLTVIPLTKIGGAIGFISSERHKRLMNTLSEYLSRE